jgi:hypothetical protein
MQPGSSGTVVPVALRLILLLEEGMPPYRPATMRRLEGIQLLLRGMLFH